MIVVDDAGQRLAPGDAPGRGGGAVAADERSSPPRLVAPVDDVRLSVAPVGVRATP